MTISKRLPLTWTCALGFMFASSSIAMGQEPQRQPTRRVVPQQQRQPEAPQQNRGGAEQRQPLRRVPGRSERSVPALDPNTGKFQLRREIYLRPPRVLPVPITRQWHLGVRTDDAPKGLRIRQVTPNSPAWRFGLEEGDYLLDVMGYPVGYYEGAYYPFAETLNQHTQRDGWVNLLVWNHRTSAEESLWVQAEARRVFETRESSK